MKSVSSICFQRGLSSRKDGAQKYLPGSPVDSPVSMRRCFQRRSSSEKKNGANGVSTRNPGTGNPVDVAGAISPTMSRCILRVNGPSDDLDNPL
ncbi:unnamed protein product [Lasius platythorax]|uniref:Uncharacterized protein n=1 Tax=Lasius platythorax TaxID=488582 RepID=A0AAV2NET6_9HYME